MQDRETAPKCKSILFWDLSWHVLRTLNSAYSSCSEFKFLSFGLYYAIESSNKVTIMLIIKFEETAHRTLPPCLKNIGKKDYTIQLRIKEMNIADQVEVYWEQRYATIS